MPIQANWPIKLTTPLGDDVLIPDSYTATEGISQLFLLRVEAATQDVSPIDFEDLLGQPVTIELKLPGGDDSRYWNGIVSRIAQGNAGFSNIPYTLEVVPKFWTLTRVSRSRIFQQKTVPDILREVLTGLDISLTTTGTYPERNYCVQYRETDFHFASRLMEEEGIFYFFTHADGQHQMVITDTPANHPAVPGEGTLNYFTVGGTAQKAAIQAWQKVQEIRTGDFTLWDHSFELPNQNLEAKKTTQDSVTVGTGSVELNSASSAFEQYDYPGGYAKWFDGVSAGGGDQASDIQNIFQENTRVVGLRTQTDTAQGLVFLAESNSREVVSGHKFTLEGHASDDSDFVVVSAESSASHPVGTAASGDNFQYSNRFTCIPLALPFRPPRVTPTPIVRGAQTAVVVGGSGEEIYTDKYGRVKVQFNWDRDGQKDANSSCWLRVATPWAGKQWGIIHIPRVGQEVLVDFLEGDPDRPIIVGSVYNADQMPPYTLPANKTQSGIKSRSSKNGGTDNFNEIRFEDKKDSEDIFIHAEKDMHTEVENDEHHHVFHDRTTTIKNDETKTVEDGNETITIKTGNQSTTVKTGNQTIEVSTGNQSTTIKTGNQSLEISTGNQTVAIKMGNQSTKLDLGQSTTEAMQSIELKVGQSSVKLDQTGVTIQGMMIKIQGQIQVQIQGTMTQISGDAMLTAKGGIVMIN